MLNCFARLPGELSMTLKQAFKTLLQRQDFKIENTNGGQFGLVVVKRGKKLVMVTAI